MSARPIQLRGVRVHNLKSVDLDIPSRKLVAFCGVSGSGKTSLALDTLYAEGQRRYIESFSAYTRQFLEQLDKPDAEHIEGIPPAIAVTHKDHARSTRATIGTSTEIDDYLRLLFAKLGRVTCPQCGVTVQQHTPTSIASQIAALPDGTKLMITFSKAVEAFADLEPALVDLREDGFVRAIVGQTTIDLASTSSAAAVGDTPPLTFPLTVQPVVDRLVAGEAKSARVVDSLETALDKGAGACRLLVACDDRAAGDAHEGEPLEASASKTCDIQRRTIDGRAYRDQAFSTSLRCGSCEVDFPTLDPRLFSFNSPLGACPECEGFGNIVDIDMELVVPDPGKSLREGAIAPWNTPAYEHELQELLALAEDYELPTDVAFSKLNERQRQLIREGVPERDFGGLNGFFAWLEKRKYKMHLRVFLSRWRSYRPCPACDGARLRPEALAVQVGGRNLAQIAQAKIVESLDFFQHLELTPWQQQVSRVMLEQVITRLGFLDSVGLGYLTLDRTLRTLSGGESQRVTLTSALGSSLVNMLYVLDEPSVGLHPRDIDRLIQSVQALRDRGNTVVVVEHEEAMLRAADHIIEIGPGAGEHGGRVVYQGPLAGMLTDKESTTGDFLAGRRGVALPEQRREPNHGWIRLTGARGNNLKNISVEFPLGLLCLVSGVSGAGKSTLVLDTLYGAVCRRKRKEVPKPYAYDDVFGDGQIDDVILIDQSPIGRSPRSNPVTYVKAFDDIRAVFAETIDARTHNYTAGHFSFNVDGGRCPGCKGDGFVAIDMQFLADVYMKCDQCGGTRYRREILDVRYRNRNIADVLDMTVRQAFSFFRGQTKVQAKLRRLIDVGLDYLRLGQPANTLSSGEAQRLKLAAYISSAKRNRTLFMMDEPTTGLHYSDVVQLLDCFDMLINVGHSLIVVEHNLQMMKAADYIIDLGPGPAEEGGTVMVQGTPEKVAHCKDSVTGSFLREALAERLRDQSA